MTGRKRVEEGGLVLKTKADAMKFSINLKSMQNTHLLAFSLKIIEYNFCQAFQSWFPEIHASPKYHAHTQTSSFPLVFGANFELLSKSSSFLRRGFFL